MPLHDVARAFLAVYFTLVAVLYAAKMMGARHRTGISYANAGPPGTSQYVAHRVFGVFRVGIWAVCVARLVLPSFDSLLLPLPGYGLALVELMGMALMVVALAIAVYVQAYMDTDWRSGVPDAGPHVLLTNGPFAVTRHPALVGVVVGQVGFFLALPTLFSLVCLLIGLTVVRRQSAFEDEALATRFGDEFARYARRVPRWPGGGTGGGGQSLPVATGQSARAPHSAHEPS